MSRPYVRENEPLARQLLADAWSDPEFISSYARWTIDILEQQRHYHYRVAEQAACTAASGAPSLNSALFALTAVGALLHLLDPHAVAVADDDVFSGARRLAARRARAIRGLSAGRHFRTAGPISRAPSIASARRSVKHLGGRCAGLKAAIEAAIALILEEHQDWHLLVRPHNLPLA